MTIRARQTRLALFVVVAATFTTSACDSVPECVELTVTFGSDVTQSRIDEINAGIGAQIVAYPIATTTYVVRLRHGQNPAEAIDYYESFPEVVAAGESGVFAPPLDGPDGARAVPGCLDAS